MGAASFLEDLEDRRIEGQILSGVSQFEEHQRARLRSGTLTEDSLRRDLDILRQRIITPLEAIKEKAGEQGLDLGNQLLKLQAEINTASSSMEKLLATLALEDGAQAAGGDALPKFLTSFVDQYRLLLRVLRAIAKPLSAANRGKLDRIREACERDVRQVKSLAQRLAAREQTIALLYNKLDEMQKELDHARYPGMRELDATGYHDFGTYAADMKIGRLKK